MIVFDPLVVTVGEPVTTPLYVEVGSDKITIPEPPAPPLVETPPPPAPALPGIRSCPRPGHRSPAAPARS